MGLSRSDESRHDFAFIAGAIIGAIAGALVTLALTPMSGADTREKLKSRAGELGPIKEKAMGATAPVREKAGTLATTAAERGKTLAATGKERASELAAKAPIGRGSHDETGMSPEEAGSMLFDSQPGAHPGGTVTPAALADAGADDIDSSHLEATASSVADAATSVSGTIERPPRIRPIETTDSDSQSGSEAESGNGRISETPSSS